MHNVQPSVLCFLIEEEELKLKEILISYQQNPMLFVCTDSKGQLYVAICEDVEEERYILVEVSLESLANALSKEITIWDLIHSAPFFWHIYGKENPKDDIVLKKDIELLNLSNVLYRNSYFNVVTKSHRRLLEDLRTQVNEQT